MSVLSAFGAGTSKAEGAAMTFPAKISAIAGF
jgi:hypothetical protein